MFQATRIPFWSPEADQPTPWPGLEPPQDPCTRSSGETSPGRLASRAGIQARHKAPPAAGATGGTWGERGAVWGESLEKGRVGRQQGQAGPHKGEDGQADSEVEKEEPHGFRR